MSRRLRILSILLFMYTHLAWGQHKLAIGITASPTFSHIRYAYRYFYPESDGQLVEPLYVNGTRWLSGYSAGLSVQYTYAPGWSVSSGILFEQLTIQQNRQPAAGKGIITLHNRVLRLPVYLTYSASKKRLSPYFSLGFLIDLPITSRIIVEREGESTQRLRLKTPFSPIFHLALGAGLIYQFSKRCTAVAQPIWAYKLGQFGGSNEYDPSYELSLQTQLTYSF